MAVRPGVGFGGLYEQPFLNEDGKVSKPWYDFLIGLTARANSSGTVTDLTGNLTANELVVGNGSQDLKVLGTLGTVHTLLHGNAAGLPSFAAVDLTADVGNVLPIANGGLGISTMPTNGQIPIGNGTVYVPATLTAGAGISVTNGAGSVTVASTYAPIVLTTVTIANAAMLTIPTTPVTLIAAPGASSRIILVSADIRASLTGVYTNVNAAAYLSLQWGTATGNNFSNYIANDATVSPTLADATNLLHVNSISTVSLINFSQVNTPTTNQWGNASFVLPSDNANQPLILFMSNAGSGNLTGGNAANSIVVRLLTMTVAIP